jgi:hypothetical protein
MVSARRIERDENDVRRTRSNGAEREPGYAGNEKE